MNRKRFGLHPSTLGHEPIRTYTEALAEVVRVHSLAVNVSTAGEWTLGDLAQHLTEVQNFWSWIIENRPNGPEGMAELPDTPNAAEGETAPVAAAEGLLAANRRLLTCLEGLDLEESAWSWYGALPTVEFTWRRQTHEALVHCFDGILAVDATWPSVEPELAADGVDELLTVMAGGSPSWARVDRSGQRILLEADDTGDKWCLEFATITGRSPKGTDYVDEPTTIQVEPTLSASAQIRGKALDINLWAWGRIPDVSLVLTGSQAATRQLRDLIIDSTQ